MKRTLATLTVVIALAATPFAADNPAIEHFSKAVAFYHSFDGKVEADMSPTSGAPITPLKTDPKNYAPGLFGQALKSGDFDLPYDLGDSQITRSGAAAIWVAKTSKRDDASYFWPMRLLGSDRMFMIGRMGDPLNKEALYGYGEIQGAKGECAIMGGALDWKEGEWHLLVLNIRSETIEFSVDGQPPLQAKLNKPTGVPAETKANAERVMISTVRAEGDPFLMDEVILFNAPLSPEEIAWLYENGKKTK